MTAAYKLYGTPEFDGAVWIEKALATSASFTAISLWNEATASQKLVSANDWEGIGAEIGVF